MSHSIFRINVVPTVRRSARIGVTRRVTIIAACRRLVIQPVMVPVGRRKGHAPFAIVLPLE